MNIGIDVSDLSTNRADGTTRYTYELARRLPALGSQHAWQFYAPFNSPSITRVIQEGANVRRSTGSRSRHQSQEGSEAPKPRTEGHSPTTSGKWPSGTGVQKVIAPFPKYWTQLRLPLELYRHRPDVLFMPIQQLPYLRPGKMKTVATIHDLAFHKFPQQFTHKDWALLHLFTAYTARYADHIIAVSQSTAHDIAHYYGRTKNVHVIHHGVNHEVFRQPDDPQRQSSWNKLHTTYPHLRQPYILFVGQLQPRKNIERLVAAFEQLRQTNSGLQLVIAGGHGWLQKPILQRILHSSVHEHIILAGHVPDDLLPSMYWHAEVFVLPSLYEGFGMPILEAQACGCPVVTSNVSSMPEIVDKSAVLVDPHSSARIAEGILNAMRNRTTLIQQGVANAQKFSWDVCAQQTLDILR